MIKVTGLTFTPIHTFLPQKPKSTALIQNPSKDYEAIPERYIALADGVNGTQWSNYKDSYPFSLDTSNQINFTTENQINEDIANLN
jgi:hypothetical protein